MKALIFLVAALLCVASGAQAQGVVYNKPMYDPASKSYFELVKVPKELNPGGYIPALPFDKAMVAASGRSFKGTKGRLAVIRSHETHMFIMQNFRADEEFWIGLRYFCKQRQLRWVTGEVWSKGQFAAWDTNWDHSDNAGCVKNVGEADWMPVAYKPVQQGFRWMARGAKKIYVAFLVEYPTGHE